MSGVPVPLITHGEMAVLAPHRAEIMALAESIRTPDDTMRVLMRYAGIQHADCLWGLVPGSLTDELSPFNECAHADLAAVKAILLRLRDQPGMAHVAGDLVSRIDAEMTAKGAAFIGCQFSGEGFNTAEFVRPDWTGVFTHWPSLISLSVALGGLPGLAFAASRLRRGFDGGPV